MTPIFYAVTNLREQSVTQILPWEFRPAEFPSDEIRQNKKSRQEFYKDPTTLWQFYTGIEGSNPNARVSKNNPPRKLHAIVADVDMQLEDSRVSQIVASMKYPPSWSERSLGNNVRLVFLLARPLIVHSGDFAVFTLQQARKWLELDLLPGLDNAVEDPARLYANGAQWRCTGAPPISEDACQKFFVDTGAAYNFKDCGTGTEIPLDIAETKLREKYPAFSWPADFALESTGPSFWIAGSASTNSAIVKKEGFFTFSDHAEKAFYNWADLLGADFAADFQTTAVASATKDVFFDSKLYWAFNEVEDRFLSMSRETLTNHLKVNCRVSTKPDKGGISMLDRVLAHINLNGRVEGGAPILFQPPGLIEYSGCKLVNTAPRSKLIRPSGIQSDWGSFPLVSRVLDNLFDPPEQLEHFLAWLAYFYRGAHSGNPGPGQNIFLVGGPGVGKTLLNREIVGGLMGGHADASKFLLGDASFNSSLFQSALWSVDDETISDNEAAHRKFSSYVKLCAANQSFFYKKKFECDLMIPWAGRVFITLNQDDSSSRSIPQLGGSVLDKISLFRCHATPRVDFPERHVIQKTLAAELPNFAQWLLEWAIPEYCLGTARYGVKAYHEPTLIDKAHQSGGSAPLKEIVLHYLQQWFIDNPEAKQWRGSVTSLVRALHADFLNEGIMRSLPLAQINRFLEIIAKEGTLTMHSESGTHKTRLWVVERF